jgi:hypothetical protein
MSREEVLRLLALWTVPVNSASNNVEVNDLESRRPVMEAAALVGSSQQDRDLVMALCRYQLANPAPGFDAAARALGQIYLEQSDTVLAVMASLPGIERIRLHPYLTFGWNKVIADRNQSLPKIVNLQKKMDRYSASLMNAAREPGQ